MFALLKFSLTPHSARRFNFVEQPKSLGRAFARPDPQCLVRGPSFLASERLHGSKTAKLLIGGGPHGDASHALPDLHHQFRASCRREIGRFVHMIANGIKIAENAGLAESLGHRQAHRNPRFDLDHGFANAQ